MAAVKKRPKLELPGGKSPFDGLHISSHDALTAQKQRSRCSECGSSRKYFCYTCYIPVPDLMGKIPKLKLPIKVDIVKHAREVDGKSTAVHAAVLAPEDVTVYTYPCIPDYDDPTQQVVLVYPGSDAVSLDELIQAKAKKDGVPNSKEGATRPFDKVVFIDCTWNQTNQISKDERLRDLQCVILTDRKTCFWRGQDKPDSYLATIEAIYYFMTDYQKVLGSEVSDLRHHDDDASHRYDDLLYFYSFMYELVHRGESGGATKAKVENG